MFELFWPKTRNNWSHVKLQIAVSALYGTMVTTAATSTRQVHTEKHTHTHNFLKPGQAEKHVCVYSWSNAQRSCRPDQSEPELNLENHQGANEPNALFFFCLIFFKAAKNICPIRINPLCPRCTLTGGHQAAANFHCPRLLNYYSTGNGNAHTRTRTFP